MDTTVHEKEKKVELPAQDPRFFSASGALLRKEDQVIVNIWSSEDNKSLPGLNVGHVAIETPARYISLWPGARPPRGARSSIAPIAKIQSDLDSYFKSRPPSWKANYLDDCVSEAISEKRCRGIDRLDQCSPHEQAIAVSKEGGITILNEKTPIPEDSQLVAVHLAHANVRIALYGLHVGKIHAEFDRLQTSVAGWRLVGSNFLSRLTDSTSKENCASLGYRILSAGGMYKGTLKVKGSSQNASVSTPDVLIKQAMAAKQRELDTHAETRTWTFPGESSLAALQKAYGEKGSEPSVSRISVVASGLKKGKEEAPKEEAATGSCVMM